MKSLSAKRLLLLLLALSMMLSLTACKKADSGDPGPDPSGEESEINYETDDEEFVDDPIDRPSLIDKVTGSGGLGRNRDTVGWIYLPDTTVDDAVLQYTDNDYYLRLTEDKVYDIYGCYFMDYESRQGSSEALSKNNIIYGHSDYRDNPSGPKFSQLYHYLDIDFVREHPYLYYSTKEEDMAFKIFAVFFTNIDATSDDYFYYIAADPSASRFEALVAEAKLRSEYIINVDVKDGDKILTLSTCSGQFVPGDTENYRLVIMGKLMPQDRLLNRTMEVEVNPNPKRT